MSDAITTINITFMLHYLYFDHYLHLYLRGIFSIPAFMNCWKIKLNSAGDDWTHSSKAEGVDASQAAVCNHSTAVVIVWLGKKDLNTLTPLAKLSGSPKYLFEVWNRQHLFQFGEKLPH